MPIDSAIAEAVRAYVTVPAHVAAIASACTYDLLYGPTYTARPEAGWEAFDGDNVATYPEDVEGEPVAVYGAPADVLRDWIGEALPSALYVDPECGAVMESEPEGEWLNGDTLEPCEPDDDGAEWFEPSPYYALDCDAVKRALFGETFARHFA